MSKRIIAPRRLLALAFGAPALSTAAALMAIALLTAPTNPRPFEPRSDTAVSLTSQSPTDSPKSSPLVIGARVTAQSANGNDVIASPTPVPAPTSTEAPAAATASAVAAREPAALHPAPALTPPPTPVPTPTPIPGEYRPDITEQLYILLNNERTSRGLSPVVRNASLVGSAEAYVQLIFLRDPYDLNHWLDGGPGDRAWSRGYCCGVGEIIVESEGSAQGMVELWMSSAPHRAVILDAQYVAFGIACYGGPVIGDDGNVHQPIVCVGDFGSG